MQQPLFGARSAESFAVEFARTIQPELVRLDNERRHYLRIALAIWAVAAAVSAGLLVLVWWRGSGVPALILASVMPLAVGWAASLSPAGRYRDAVRAIVMPPVCRFVGDLEYARTPRSGIEPMPLEMIGLLPAHSEVSQEDEIRGRYRGTEFSMVEMTLRRVRRSGKKRKTTTVFHGVVLALALPQPTEARVLIEREAGVIGRSLANTSAAMRGLALVEFADQPFEKEFRVYSDSPAEAQRLLGPLMRACLMAIAADRQRINFKAAFTRDRFFCAFTSASLIEPGSLARPAATLAEDVQRLLREVTLPHRIVDNLHGNRASAP